MSPYEQGREARRRFMRRNLYWIAPIGMIGGVGLFIGVGFLVTWLWRVTVADIFGFKLISFWQAWGLLLLSQFLFKGTVQPTMRTGRRWRGATAYGDGPDPEASPPPGSRES